MSLSLQDTISILNDYWVSNGCTIIHPYTSELGAATLHPATALRAIDNRRYNLAYVQPSIRPSDGRYGKSPNRLYQHHQYQVFLKPSPDDLQNLYLKSLNKIGIRTNEHDIRFIDDNWENPSIGASGVGWEVWCNGTEISQFTYMQQVGGLECPFIPGELAYGLERIAMFIQNIDNVYDIKWSNEITYKELFYKNESDFSVATFSEYNTHKLHLLFNEIEEFAKQLLKKDLPVAAYDQCTKASHIVNLLDARKALDTSKRAGYILKIRELVKECCFKWSEYQINETKTESTKHNKQK